MGFDLVMQKLEQQEQVMNEMEKRLERVEQALKRILSVTITNPRLHDAILRKLEGGE